ncbi:MAG: hypothetical protein NW224_12815 [Leptolyngbyaceae cyanobacterium bins.302]|nr:hypothetical protein [Leptolyngbyaceae cyanobacterium bins.302]
MAELHPGWLLPDLITLDHEYQGRYALWRTTLETGNITADIPQTAFLTVGDAGFDRGLAMLTTCLDAIPPSGLSASHTLPYFVTRTRDGRQQLSRLGSYWLTKQ